MLEKSSSTISSCLGCGTERLNAQPVLRSVDYGWYPTCKDWKSSSFTTEQRGAFSGQEGSLDAARLDISPVLSKEISVHWYL